MQEGEADCVAEADETGLGVIAEPVEPGVGLGAAHPVTTISRQSKGHGLLEGQIAVAGSGILPA